MCHKCFIKIVESEAGDELYAKDCKEVTDRRAIDIFKEFCDRVDLFSPADEPIEMLENLTFTYTREEWIALQSVMHTYNDYAAKQQMRLLLGNMLGGSPSEHEGSSEIGGYI